MKEIDVLNSMINLCITGLLEKFDDIIREGIKRKGFEFKTDSELREFIQTRCRIEDNTQVMERTFFIDDTPFLFHSYAPELPLQFDNDPIKFTATYGSFTYL